MKGSFQSAAILLAAAAITAGCSSSEGRAREALDEAQADFRAAQYERASAALARASQTAEQAGLTGLRATIASWTAIVDAERGDWAGAEQAIGVSEKLAAQAGDSRLAAEAAGSAGYVRMLQMKDEPALQDFERQLGLLQPDDRAARAAVLNNMGTCHYRLGEFDEALADYKQALALNAASGLVDEQAVCLGNMGNVYLDRAEYNEAKARYLEAIGLYRGNPETLAKFYSNTARAAIALRQWAEAEQYNDKALAIKRREKRGASELYSLRNAALIAQGKGDTAAAEGLFTRVIEAPSEDPTPALECEAGLAKLYASTGRPRLADQRFEAALSTIEQSRGRLVRPELKLSFLASLISFYREYVGFLLAQGETERALAAAEASRARLLCERLGVNACADATTGVPYRQLAVSSGAVLLSYWIAPERSYVWVITGRDITAFTLPAQGVIRERVERYGALIENLADPLEIEDSTRAELYTALLGPIRDRIPKGSRIVVVPDGPLHSLNLETLPAEPGGRGYLIEEATISVTPGLNLLAGRRTAAAGEGQARWLLLIGDPETNDRRLPRLPYAGEEMASVERHFAAGAVRELRGRQADPAAYRGAAAGGPFGYVHFTAHAIADREHPLESAILLAGSAESGRLTAKAVLEQPLEARLVTLSACRTAGARTYAGEGLVGFTWAFFQAGAGSVIAGLWDVSDESTPRLMDRLYGGMVAGEDAATALRAAKLDLLHSKTAFRLPYYWAPFGLYVRTAAP